MSEALQSERQTAARREPSWLDGYRSIPGVADELLDAAGAPRPVWARFLADLDRLGAKQLSGRFARADQYLRDAGVFYRVYDGSGENEREWPLAHVPMLIAEAEWNSIADGLIQRADLLEAVVADLYGRNHLVERGLLPPQLIAASPEYLRPMAGIVPAGGHFLHFCAFELGRGKDGRWWVLGDRIQAPSGAGFALENRVATTRALAEIFSEMHVHRLAGFFRQFRDGLHGLAARNGGRAAILTPGPLNDTYYEQAYIARYLGIPLLEGEDLTVSDGRLMVRTVSGPKPIGVLWRRLDANFADPLELNPDSRIGTPGLVQALRKGSASLANALGCGILETRALLAFLPRIAKALTGQSLALPNIATWWCGQDAECRHVSANLDAMMVGPALSTRLPFEDDEATVLGSALAESERATLRERLAGDGSDWVGQEAISLSTTPFYTRGRLEPRPAILRVFLARTASSWTVMPGGFARIGASADARAIAMQRGGRAADVWVVASSPVHPDTLLAGDEAGPIRAEPGNLPSRAAENLLWLGRYVERAEHSARTLRAYHIRLTETGDPRTPLLLTLQAHLRSLGQEGDSVVGAGLLSPIDRAVGSAGRVRDRFSPDGWLALRDLAKTAHRFADDIAPGADASRAMTILLRKLAGFSGLLNENMYRSTGWGFLEIGRRLERGIQTARLLRWLTRSQAPNGALETMLEIGDSVLTSRRLYQGHPGARTVRELLGLDPLNPRSIRFQLDRLKDEIDRLVDRAERTGDRATSRDVRRLQADFANRQAHELGGADLDGVAGDLARLYNTLAAEFFP